MIPNWLLGKSKSKLQEILGGGGGGGTTYTAGTGIDITNDEISVDPLLMVDIEQTALAIPTKAAKTQISNPNIFHNPWFSVNQRAVTSATQNADYIADRWMVYFGENNATITRNDDGNIVMDNSLGTTNITIYQKRTQTYLKSLVGQKLTASMMLSDGTIYSGTITYTGTGNPVYFENDYVKAHAPVLTANQIITFSVKPGASVTIKALKLEVGEISTLAMDPRPEYAAELLKCQRYFQRIGLTQYENIGSGIIKTSQIATCVINIQPLRKDLKTVGDVSLHGTVYIWNGTHFDGTGDQSTSLNAFAIGKDGYGTIDFNSTGLTVSSPAVFQFRDAASYIDFNAEL